MRFILICTGTVAALVAAHRVQGQYGLTDWGLYMLIGGAVIALTVVITVLAFGGMAILHSKPGFDPFYSERPLGVRISGYVMLVLVEVRLCFILSVPLAFVTEIATVSTK